MAQSYLRPIVTTRNGRAPRSGRYLPSYRVVFRSSIYITAVSDEQNSREGVAPLSEAATATIRARLNSCHCTVPFHTSKDSPLFCTSLKKIPRNGKRRSGGLEPYLPYADLKSNIFHHIINRTR